MRTSGDATVRATASMRAILVTTVLAGSGLIGSAAYAHAAETHGLDPSRAPVVQEQAVPHVLTELARPRFTEPR
jgi:hypothetical protein